MRTFTVKPRAPEQTTPPKSTLLRQACFEQSRVARIQHWQGGAMGHQALPWQSEPKRENRQGDTPPTENHRVVTAVPPIVNEVLRTSGKPLDPTTRTFMEAGFGHDFGHVRLHTDTKAAVSARAIDALAYTVGGDIAFADGKYQPGTAAGKRLLAHELTHVLQQGTLTPSEPARLAGGLASRMGGLTNGSEAEADRAAEDTVLGRRPASVAPEGGPRLQREAFGAPPVSVRSPAFEELVTQLSTVEAAVHARPLTRDEQSLVRGVFGSSIDYGRVRLIPTAVLEYRTVANTIRVPEGFTITDANMAQTLIHALTHVWQYQHGGTGYISLSLASQIAATFRTGSRNAAYGYQITPGQTFFDFTPEQQGLLVENYFAMRRDQASIPASPAAGRARNYLSNHLDSSGDYIILSAADRQAEIARDLPLHEPLIQQMRTALPRREASVLLERAQEVMRAPLVERAPTPPERQLTPVKPLIEISF